MFKGIKYDRKLQRIHSSNIPEGALVFYNTFYNMPLQIHIFTTMLFEAYIGATAAITFKQKPRKDALD